MKSLAKNVRCTPIVACTHDGDGHDGDGHDGDSDGGDGQHDVGHYGDGHGGDGQHGVGRDGDGYDQNLPRRGSSPRKQMWSRQPCILPTPGSLRTLWGPPCTPHATSIFAAAVGKAAER